MSNPIWQQSKTERITSIEKAFAGVVPAERRVPTLAQQLRTIRALIVKKRAEGFTVDQICTALQHPDVSVIASGSSIRRILTEAERRRERRRKARDAALLARVTGSASDVPATVPAPTPTR